MAIAVVYMGLSPTEYRNLTLLERDVIFETFKKSRKQN